MSDETRTLDNWPHWKMPGRSNRYHLILAGRSLCMKWGFLSGDPVEPWRPEKITLGKGPEDCAECWKRAAKNYSTQEPKS